MTLTKGFCLHIDFNTISKDYKQLFMPYLCLIAAKECITHSSESLNHYVVTYHTGDEYTYINVCCDTGTITDEQAEQMKKPVEEEVIRMVTRFNVDPHVDVIYGAGNILGIVRTTFKKIENHEPEYSIDDFHPSIQVFQI